MKASAELGIQPCQFQRSGRRGYRVTAKASYVDESLFGSPAGRLNARAEFDPPWVCKNASSPRPLLWSPKTTQWEVDTSPSTAAPPTSTPRKGNKYRLKSHTPSYCDETLFGPKPGGREQATPWMMKGEVAKLRPLLLTPPSAVRDQPVLSPRPKDTPLTAFHRETPDTQGKEAFGTWRGGESSALGHPENRLDADTRDFLGRAPRQPVIQLYKTSEGSQAYLSKPRTSMEQDHQCSGASPRSLPRPRSNNLSGLSSARVIKATSSCKPRPPWK
ncbi:RBPJ-interacting and tubulin-associated protein 1 [Zootoca vivipara]|uniref:RBPJ-interacting and tubulin-associated protein 1 n=1 Tax=Zootoca vivipara TaxID=8524 RepID=UPI001591BEDA|nr:RBPJ-interacting and tubulin-associated protein 1 [Zootoca vivipara]XP_034954398.1 RBPJ-interacting and tubulin-associated protein 1 [Zootoca vivipara]XP_034954399.1 RBPJ-interacting and tubulin-associated protein 1 [Zootoca vivipara]XP_034954400.1 RBPJ-interacting and tubulin-associated protein 1 [Zootoca vivipara]XP_034954401.1 RBPJ-interacting and tubulin-associated protein 1 [Zootoca vivipara]XP_034954402.1 RBPJ-interacting and tubulin-associated protein 1 [Zootoca vivipara]XP_06012543